MLGAKLGGPVPHHSLETFTALVFTVPLESGTFQELLGVQSHWPLCTVCVVALAETQQD